MTDQPTPTPFELSSHCGTLRTVVLPSETPAGFNVLVTNARTGEVTLLPNVGTDDLFPFSVAMSVSAAIVNTFDSAISWGAFPG